MAEVAGLVLAAIPILIEGIKAYSKGVSTVTIFLRYQIPLEDLAQVLGAEETIYRNICNQLLQGLVDNKRKAELLQNPGGNVWKDPDLQAGLEERLSTSYDAFSRTVKSMEAAMEEIKKLLKLDSRGKVQLNENNKFRREYKRLKFSLHREDYDKLVSKITENNRRLNLLINHHLYEESAKPRGRRQSPNFSLIQDYAARVYQIICASFSCKCQSVHGISLLLENRKYHSIDGCVALPNLQLALSYNLTDTQTDNTPWALEAVEVRLIQEDSNANSQEALTLSGKASREARIRNPQPTPAESNAPKMPELSPINNFCEEMQRLGKRAQGRGIGFLVDQKTTQRLAVFPPSLPFLDLKSQKLRSLGSMLNPINSIGVRKLSLLNRKRLAVTLASSFLQLCRTPWMKETWGNQDILFLDINTGNSLDWPLIMSGLYVSPTVPIGISESPSKPYPFQSRNPAVFALGILLIELCFAKTFKTLRRETSLPGWTSQNSVPDYVVAEALLEGVYEEGGDRYGHAVRRCIRCEFDSRSNSLDSETFLEKVHEKVVILLQEDLSNFCQD